MNEDAPTMSVGDGGFSGSAAATGPNAGWDPILGKFRRKLKKRRSKEEKKLVAPGNTFEAYEAPCDRPSRLFQYKVTVPEMGTTIIYATSPAELMTKFRMLFNPRFIKQISIERVSPYEAGEIFYNKRLRHIRNIKSD